MKPLPFTLEPGEELIDGKSFVAVALAVPMAKQIRRAGPDKFAVRMPVASNEVVRRVRCASTQTATVAMEISRANSESLIEIPFKITDYINITKTE
jgi:hypothetical protein